MPYKHWKFGTTRPHPSTFGPSVPNKTVFVFYSTPYRNFLGGASLKSNMEHHSHVIFLLSSILRKITEAVNKNKTYCFSTEKGPFGWCATCKVGLIFSITKRSRRDAVTEGLLIWIWWLKIPTDCVFVLLSFHRISLFCCEVSMCQIETTQIR